MFINFYFQVYRKQHSSSKDYFELILGRIPDEYKFNRHKVKSTCLALDNKLFCLLYTSPSPRDRTRSRMPSSA